MVPQSDPKATQMDMAEPFKTYGIYCTGATLGQLGRGWKSIFVSACFSGAYFFRFLLTFIDFGAKMVPKMEYPFLRVWLRIAPFSDKDPKSVHNGLQEGSKDQK